MATIRDEEIEIVLENIDYIPGYKEAEIERRTNEIQRQSNETKRQTLYNQMQDDYDKGRFNGATFTPTVDSECNIIWTNDKGLPNPETVNVKGDKGDTGAKGETGDTGATGNGIASIEKTSTSGLVDTYTITFTNGTTTTFQITNGANGTNGTNGQDGYTPVRTVDYWTDSDVSAMESHCDTYIDSKIGYINEALASLTTVGGGN